MFRTKFSCSPGKCSYDPDLHSRSGEVLKECLECSGLTKAELARSIGISRQIIHEIIKGNASISSNIAYRLSYVFAHSPHFWLKLEINFQLDRARRAFEEELQTQLDHLDKALLQELIEKGLISDQGNKIDHLKTILRFYGVASLQHLLSELYLKV